MIEASLVYNPGKQVPGKPRATERNFVSKTKQQINKIIIILIET